MPKPDEPFDRTHLGQGIAFPISMNVQGGLRLSVAERNIEDAIYLILRTQIGERLYRPDFGCRLSELVFAPMNTQTLLLIRLYVEEALEMWEPRIVLDEVRTDPDPVRGRVDISILYHPKDSPSQRNLVYPFYLLPTNNSEAQV
jgi:phage baseplate assembly protein W